MALNVSNTGDGKNLTFGPGVLLITTDILATPNVDIGYVQGAQFQVQKQKLQVKQGSPKTLVKQFGQEEDVSLSVTGIEWNLNHLRLVFGGGNIKSSGSIFAFGGNVDFLEVALLFRHQLPSGGTVEVRLWRCQGNGDINVQFNDNLQEFPYSFQALEATNSWGGGSLPQDERRGQIVYLKAA